jgi:glucose dehydrogenase
VTYGLSESGKQFVVIAAGGRDKGRIKMGDYVVRFRCLEETASTGHL